MSILKGKRRANALVGLYGSAGQRIVETTLAATVPLGESVEFAAAVDGATHANTAWQWPYDNNPPEGSTPTATAASGATVEAVRRDPGKHTLLATDADDDDIAAYATLTSVGVQKLTATEYGNKNNADRKSTRLNSSHYS